MNRFATNLKPLKLSLCDQKKYKEEAEKTMSHYVPVLDTPEMQRVRENQKNFSTVSRTPRNRASYWRTSLSLAEAEQRLCLSPCLNLKYYTEYFMCTIISGMYFKL